MRNSLLKRRWVFLLALLCINGIAINQVSNADAPDVSAQIRKFSTEELHTLVAPIALYPDALLAQLLPASAFPIQIVDAYRFIQNGGNADAMPQTETWDSSVVALLHYPTALKKMNDDLMWTEQLGVAVTYQMDDVSLAIQQVRAEARAAGNLVSNDKQVVEKENEIIQIVPANPQIIYVPEYDPYLIYESRLDDPFFWGTGFSFGLWLGNSWDWHHHRIWINSYWGGGRWNRSGRPSYWSAPYRSIPNWYSRTGSGGFSGNRVNLRGVPANRSTSQLGTRTTPNVAPSHPNISSSTTRTAPHTLLDNADLKNRGAQSRIESARGQSSRTITTPVVPRETPRIQQERPSTTPHPSFHEGSSSNRGTVERQSSRGSSSRSSGGGGGRHR